MTKLRTFGLACFAAFLMAAAPRAATAQQKVSVDFRGGLGIPTGDLGNVEDMGPAFTVGLDVGIHPRIALRAEGGAEIYSGTDLSTGETAPNMTLTHFNGGVLFHLMPPASDQRFSADVNVGGGITILTSERRAYSIETPGGAGTAIVDYSNVYPAINAGLSLAYALSPQVDAFVSGQGSLTLAKENDLNSQQLALIAPEATTLKNVYSFPVAVGLRFNFQP